MDHRRCIGVHIGSVAGSVVDATTGLGVPGVEIFRTYSTSPIQVMGEPSGHSFTPDWVTSGEDGEFAFPGHWLVEWSIDGVPSISWIHLDYGWDWVTTFKLDVRRLNVRLARKDENVEFLHGRGKRYMSSDSPCQEVRSHDAHAHCMSLLKRIRESARWAAAPGASSVSAQ